jgi:hypothetical protein
MQMILYRLTNQIHALQLAAVVEMWNLIHHNFFSDRRLWYKVTQQHMHHPQESFTPGITVGSTNNLSDPVSAVVRLLRHWRLSSRDRIYKKFAE